MSTEQPLAIVGDFTKAEVQTAGSITQERDKAITAAKELPVILENDKDAAKAVKAKRGLRSVRKAVEECADMLKKPLNLIRKAVDAARDGFLIELIIEEKQLDGKINNWQSKQIEANRLAEEQARKALAAKAAEAEKAGESAQQIKAAIDVASALGSETDDLEDKLLEAQLAAESMPTEQQLAAAVAPVAAVKGISGREVLDFELKGNTPREQLDNLHAFAQAYPDLCKIEIRRSAVLERLNHGDCFKSTFPEEQPLPPDWLPNPPGIRVFRTIKTQTR